LLSGLAEVIEMLLTIYLCGWLVMTVGLSIAGEWLHDRFTPPSPFTRGLIPVLGGVLWPVLLVGVCQLIALKLVFKPAASPAIRVADGAAAQRTDELIPA
jgi:hypothetical protein